jgi:cytoskeletal protein CcmA (bactofilin family)
MKNKNLFTKIGLLFMLVLLSMAFVPAAYAADGRGGDRVVIPANQVIDDDLYVGANDFVLDGTIKGDLFVAARTVTVNGTVDGDLWAVAQSVVVNGVVMDDVRIAGAVLTLGPEAQVKSDTLGAGYSLETQRGSQIGRDLLVGSYQTLMAGDLGRNAYLSSNSVAIEGTVGGNVRAQIGDNTNTGNNNPVYYMPNMPPVPYVPNGLTIGEDAKISGDLNYVSREPAIIPSGGVSGQVQQTQPVEPVQETPKNVTVFPPVVTWFLNTLRQFVTLIVVGLLLVWLVPTWIVKPAEKLQAQPWSSLGWGTVMAIIFPFAVLLLIGVVILLAVLTLGLTLGSLTGAVLSLGGSGIMSLVVVFGLVVSYLAKVIVSYLIGDFILKLINPEVAAKPVWSMLLGIVILTILLAIPFLSWFFSLVIALLGLGTLFLLWRDRSMPTSMTPQTAA